MMTRDRALALAKARLTDRAKTLHTAETILARAEGEVKRQRAEKALARARAAFEEAEAALKELSEEPRG